MQDSRSVSHFRGKEDECERLTTLRSPVTSAPWFRCHDVNSGFNQAVASEMQLVGRLK